MKLRIYTDTHLYSPIYDGTKITNVSDSYFIGDNVDLVNVRKKDYQNALKTNQYFMDNAKGYIPGNHEAISLVNQIIKIGNVMLVHGDAEAWSKKRAINYRSKKHCAGWLKRNIWVRALKNFEKIGKHKPSKKMIDNLVSHARLRDCTTIIAGHKHPRETYDKLHDGVRVIVLKRGLTEIEV